MKVGFFQKPVGSDATSNLFIANCGPAVGISEEDVKELLSPLGAERLDLQRDSIVCASFPDEPAATDAMQFLTSEAIEERYRRKFVVRYADYVPYKLAAGPPEVFLNTSNCGVPGLHLCIDFVTPEEEQALVAAVERNEWECLANRRVQHYGFRFEYKTRNVDVTQPIQELPASVLPVVERLQALPEMPETIDQLTVNEYPQGVGLAPHIDTHSAFTGAIASLSLSGGCIMEMRLANVHKAIYLPRRSLLIMSGPARYEWQHYIPHRKSDVVDGATIPRNARRVSFTFRKLLNPLQRKTSAAAQVRGFACDCKFPEHCDSQGSQLPQTRLHQLESSEANINSSENGQQEHLETAAAASLSEAEGGQESSTTGESAAEVESRHVHAVYEVIASHFSSTRFAVWPKVREFLMDLPAGGVLADIGCGNGKYFAVRPDMIILGSDRSSGLAAQAAKLCRSVGQPPTAAKHSPPAQVRGAGGNLAQWDEARTPEFNAGASVRENPHESSTGVARAPLADVLVADALRLPYKDACADAAVCIAVLHHVSSVPRRLQLLQEALRVLKRGGKALVTVWASEQEDAKKLQKWEPIPSSQVADERDVSEAARSRDFFVPWHVPFHRASSAATLRGIRRGNEGFGDATIDHTRGSVMFKRYYHLFDAKELDALIRQLQDAKLLASFYDKSNWCCIFEKL